MRNADLRGADLRDADLHAADLSHADLRDADLRRANLGGADLRGAKLGCLGKATLDGTDLGCANLIEVRLRDADLSGAVLSGAALRDADLRGAILVGTDLSRADLSYTNLTNANMSRSIVTDSTLVGALLENAFYAPRSAPPAPYLAGITGLTTVRFGPGDEPGLVQLRNLLKANGLRDLEREATFLIEHRRTTYALLDWSNDSLDRRTRSARTIEGVFRLVAFEWTTGYGLHPGRALLLIIVFWALLTPLYRRLIARAHAFPNPRSAIYRVRPKERIVDSEGKPTHAGEDLIERLQAQGRTAWGYAAYFSLLSAFHIGFREFNVGSWIARVQAHPYELVPTGWARVTSGLQSLLSVYLLAMWALTYFGRPFE